MKLTNIIMMHIKMTILMSDFQTISYSFISLCSLYYVFVLKHFICYIILLWLLAKVLCLCLIGDGVWCKSNYFCKVQIVNVYNVCTRINLFIFDDEEEEKRVNSHQFYLTRKMFDIYKNKCIRKISNKLSIQYRRRHTDDTRVNEKYKLDGCFLF